MSKIDKIDWGLKARVLELLIDYKHGGMKERDRLTRIVERAIKAESRYRRLMRILEVVCPYDRFNYHIPNCRICRGLKSKKARCWRRFVRTELDVEGK